MLSVSAPWLWIMPAYRVPPPLTETERAAIPYPVNATFDEALKLLGHTAVADNIHPGETLTLELYWEALRPTTEDHLIFIHLLGEGGRIVAQYDGFPKRGLRSTNSLQAGAAWVERYSLTVPRIANTPDTLSISIGVYNRASGVRMLTQQGTDTVQFGAIYLRSDPVRSAPEFTMHFGKGMALTNYVLSAPGVMPGQTLHITLFWECNAPMSQDYTVSLQIIDDQWHKAAQNDHWPQGGTAPTSTWRTGQKFEDTIALTVAPEATPGIYKLLLSVYYIDADGAIQHLPIQWEAHQTPVDTVTLTQVQVKAPE
ncbi:MAG: hypothetical protein BWY63_02460 [Chloroflexi bacterium ADurb.Bin360]|nr:MAG: hypothetical protein BWY63_02460 [Chloroflexi bacterium ADurb.Bin360]